MRDAESTMYVFGNHVFKLEVVWALAELAFPRRSEDPTWPNPLAGGGGGGGGGIQMSPTAAEGRERKKKKNEQESGKDELAPRLVREVTHINQINGALPRPFRARCGSWGAYHLWTHFFRRTVSLEHVNSSEKNRLLMENGCGIVFKYVFFLHIIRPIYFLEIASINTLTETKHEVHSYDVQYFFKNLVNCISTSGYTLEMTIP
ncbi:hypothetical protein ACJX0J_005544 [Zea mays]